MVLSRPGGVAACGGPPVRGLPRVLAEDRGSQTLELALLLPVLALVLVALLHGGLAASELVLAQAVARDAVRVASVDDDAAARRAAEAVAGDRALEVRTEPSADQRQVGGHVTVHVRLRSAALHRLGIEAWLPASATMRVESR
jgi:Flp pilus assembly protein TadG